MPTEFRGAVTRLLLLVLLAAPSIAAGQPPAPKPLTVDDLYRLDAPRDPALAPDGKSLAYIRQRIELSSLWFVGGDRKARPAEKGEPDARAPVFSPDGKWVAFLSTRPRPGGSANAARAAAVRPSDRRVADSRGRRRGGAARSAE